MINRGDALTIRSIAASVADHLIKYLKVERVVANGDITNSARLCMADESTRGLKMKIGFLNPHS